MPPAIRIEREVPATMRDGTVLRAEVWRPDDGAAHPAVLMRTPYVKETQVPVAILDARLAVERGYAVVVQDVRGTGTSDGVFEPFVNEEADGGETIAWLADQAWCDGRVVMAGMSYVGATQWLAAAGRPPALRAIAPTLSSDEYGEGWSFRSGVRELGFLATWSAAGLGPLDTRWFDDPERAPDALDALAAHAPWIREWFSSGPDSAYWRSLSVAARRERVEVPVLAIGGWWDLFLAATLRSWERSRNDADRLVLGPWDHDRQASHLVGEANVGVAASGWPWLFGWILDFYDAVLDGREPEAAPVRAYVVGRREWVDLPAWPPPDAAALSLDVEPGAFAVRPDDPVPSLGGRTLQVGVPGNGDGVRDQRRLVGRDDVHVALRRETPERVTLAGPVRAELSVSGPAAALWCVTLCAEQPDGALHNLCEGVARANAGDEGVSIDLGDVCVELAAGQALVALVAGSSWPRWERPPHSGTQQIHAGALRLTTR